jgi:MFS family permease
MVSLLSVAYVLSYVDRYILGLLVEPIKADMGLSDSQIGLLLGLAFAIFYATMGLPLGWLADRWRRTWLVGIGMALWSAATVMSGFARNFWQLFAARMSVGVGEATLSPCAMSMIADSFPAERRGKPIAVYSASMTIGSSLASLIGATVLIWAKSSPDLNLPLLGEIRPWQLAFIAVGAPGLLFAGLFFFMREPVRQIRALDDPDLAGSNLNDMFAYVGKRWKIFGSFMALVCLMTICAYSHGWLAATFERTWGWPAERYALVNTVVLLLVGPPTILACGYVSDRLAKKGRRDAPLQLLILGSVIHVPTGIIMMLMPTPELAWVFLAINLAGMSIVTATNALTLLAITPAKIRAQTVALYYMCMSLTGLILGPGTVGVLSEFVFGEDNLRYAVAAIPAIFGVIPLCLIPATRRLYRDQLERLQQINAADNASAADSEIPAAAGS